MVGKAQDRKLNLSHVNHSLWLGVIKDPPPSLFGAWSLLFWGVIIPQSGPLLCVALRLRKELHSPQCPARHQACSPPPLAAFPPVFLQLPQDPTAQARLGPALGGGGGGGAGVMEGAGSAGKCVRGGAGRVGCCGRSWRAKPVEWEDGRWVRGVAGRHGSWRGERAPRWCGRAGRLERRAGGAGGAGLWTEGAGAGWARVPRAPAHPAQPASARPCQALLYHRPRVTAVGAASRARPLRSPESTRMDEIFENQITNRSYWVIIVGYCSLPGLSRVTFIFQTLLPSLWACCRVLMWGVRCGHGVHTLGGVWLSVIRLESFYRGHLLLPWSPVHA